MLQRQSQRHCKGRGRALEKDRETGKQSYRTVNRVRSGEKEEREAPSQWYPIRAVLRTTEHTQCAPAARCPCPRFIAPFRFAPSQRAFVPSYPRAAVSPFPPKYVPTRVRSVVPPTAPTPHGPPQSHNLLPVNRCHLPCLAWPRLTLHCPANLVTFHPEIGSQGRSLHWLALPCPAMHRLPRFSS